MMDSKQSMKRGWLSLKVTILHSHASQMLLFPYKYKQEPAV